MNSSGYFGQVFPLFVRSCTRNCTGSTTDYSLCTTQILLSVVPSDIINMILWTLLLCTPPECYGGKVYNRRWCKRFKQYSSIDSTCCTTPAVSEVFHGIIMALLCEGCLSHGRVFFILRLWRRTMTKFSQVHNSSTGRYQFLVLVFVWHPASTIIFWRVPEWPRLLFARSAVCGVGDVLRCTWYYEYALCRVLHTLNSSIVCLVFSLAPLLSYLRNIQTPCNVIHLL